MVKMEQQRASSAESLEKRSPSGRVASADRQTVSREREVAPSQETPFISLTKNQFIFLLAFLFFGGLLGFVAYRTSLFSKLLALFGGGGDAVVIESDLGQDSSSPSDSDGSGAESEQVPLSGKALFVSDRDGNSAIYAYDLATGEESKLIENVPYRDDFSPSLSPDKRYLAFYSTRSGEKDSYGALVRKIYLYDLASGQIRLIFGEAGTDIIGWLPDSSALVASRYSTAGDVNIQEIKQYSVKDGAVSVLVANDQFSPYEQERHAYLSQDVAFSPDSRRMVFKVSHRYNPAVTGVWVYNFYDQRSWRVSARQAGGIIRFSDDGERLEFDAYQERAKKRYRVSIDSGLEEEIPLADDEKYCHRDSYFQEMGDGGSFCATNKIYSSDGERVIYIDRRNKKRDIYLANLDGSGEKRLTSMGGVRRVVFGPEEKYLLFTAYRSDDSAVFLLDLARPGEPQRLSGAKEDFVAFLEDTSYLGGGDQL